MDIWHNETDVTNREESHLMYIELVSTRKINVMLFVCYHKE